MAAADMIQAVLLSGGSAFGLDAGGGVMDYLEERGIGFDVGIQRYHLSASHVCLILWSGILRRRDRIRPWDTRRVEGAEKNNYQDGNFGADAGLPSESWGTSLSA